MIQSFTSIVAALFALQAAPETGTSESEALQDTPLTELSQLPLEQAAGPRCGVVFAMAEGMQQNGDERAKDWPDIKSGNGREFFVRSMAKLMEDRKLDQDTVLALVAKEVERLSRDDYKRVAELMPPCLLMKESAGL